MTCSKSYGRLLQAACLGLLTTLAIAGCGSDNKPVKKDASTDGIIGGDTGGTGPSQVAISPASLTFGTVQQGQVSGAQMVTVTNKGVATTLTPTVTPPGAFTVTNGCAVVPAGTTAAPGTCSISVVFSPTASTPVGDAKGTLTISATQSVALSGTVLAPTKFALVPAGTMSLGDTFKVGDAITGTVTVSTTTALTDLVCLAAGADITLGTNECTAALAANASCKVSFTLASTSAGVKNGAVTCNAGGVTQTTTVNAKVIAPAKLTVSPTSGATGATTLQTAEMVFHVGNAGGSPSGAISATVTPATDFALGATTCAGGVAPQGDCTITVIFKPATDGDKKGTLTITDASAPAAPLTVALTGAATGPSNLTVTGTGELGSVIAGSTGTPQTITVKNIGGTPAAGVSVTTSGAAFVIGNDTCKGQTLAANTGSCTVTVAYAPAPGTAAGGVQGLLTAAYEGGNPKTLPLTATTVAPASLSITPNPLAFGSLPLNVTSSDKTITVTNKGGAPTGALTVPAALSQGFVISGNTCSASLAPTESCTIAVRFTPPAVSSFAVDLTVSGATAAPATIQLTGNGTQASVLALYAIDGSTELNEVLAQNPDGFCAREVDAVEKKAGLTCFQNTILGYADGSYPTQPAPASAKITFIVKNRNTAASEGQNIASGPVTLTIGGANAADFIKADTTCGPSLDPQATCLVTLSFKPTAEGVRTGTLTVTSTNGGLAGATLAGRGLPAMRVEPCGVTYIEGKDLAKESCTHLLTTDTNKADHTGLDFGQVSLGADCSSINVKYFRVTAYTSTAADHKNLITATITDAATPSNFKILTADTAGDCMSANLDVAKGAATCWLKVQFAPQGSTMGDKSASIAVKGGSGGTGGATFKGSATGPLTMSTVYSDETAATVVNNVGPTIAVHVANNSVGTKYGPLTMTLSGDAADFQVLADTCSGSKLNPGAQCGKVYQINETGGDNQAYCAVVYQFVPKAAGTRKGTLKVTAGTETNSIDFSSVAVAENTVTIAPANLDFGPTALTNHSEWKEITLTAGNHDVQTGNLKAEFTRFNVGQFEIAQGASGQPDAAGTCGVADSIRLGGSSPSSCTIRVRFVPDYATVGDRDEDGINKMKTVLTVVDQRDTSVRASTLITGIGTSQLTITPSTQDFGVVVAGKVVSTKLTYTVTNVGSVSTKIDARDTDKGTGVIVDEPYLDTQGTCISNSTTLAAGGTCTVIVAYDPVPEIPPYQNTLKTVRVTTKANVSRAVAGITSTIHQDAKLELVGMNINPTYNAGTNPKQYFNAFDYRIDLGGATAGSTGQTATLVYKNSGGATTTPIAYYFWNGRGVQVAPVTDYSDPAGDDPIGDYLITNDTGRGHVNEAHDAFAVVSDTSANSCIGKSLKAGEYCNVQIAFKPKTNHIYVGEFEIAAEVGGSVKAATLVGRGMVATQTSDKLTLVPAYADMMAKAVVPGGAYATAKLGTGADETATRFTITNNCGATVATVMGTDVIASGDFKIDPAVAANNPTNKCGATLASGASCVFDVKYVPAASKAALRPEYVIGNVTLTTTACGGVAPASGDLSGTSKYVAGLMGSVSKSMATNNETITTQFMFTNPPEGLNGGTNGMADNKYTFGEVAQGQTSAPRVFKVTNIGDLDSTGNVVVTASSRYNVTGCGGVLKAFDPFNPAAAAANCDVTVTAVAGSATVGDLKGNITATSGDEDGVKHSDMYAKIVQPPAVQFTPSETFTFTPATPIGNEVIKKDVMVSNVDDTVDTGAITLALLEGTAEATNFTLDLANNTGDHKGPESCAAHMSSVNNALVLQKLSAENNAGKCYVSVIFNPMAMPASGTSFTATLKATAPQTVEGSVGFKGNGREAIGFTSPTGTTYDFGTHSASDAAADRTKEFVLKNDGQVKTGVLRTIIGGANAGDFVVTSDTCQGQIKDPGASCTVTVKFQPSATGARAGSLTVTGTPGGTAAFTLKATGS